MAAEEYMERLKQTGRNDACPCGSGKKYKKCHLQEDEEGRSKAMAEAAEAAAKEAEAAEETPEEKKEGRAHPDLKGRKSSPPTPKPRPGAIARQVSTPRKAGTS